MRLLSCYMFFDFEISHYEPFISLRQVSNYAGSAPHALGTYTIYQVTYIAIHQ